MKLFGSKFGENRYKKEHQGPILSRRNFLKKAAIGTLAIADIFSVNIAKNAIEKLIEFYSKEDTDEIQEIRDIEYQEGKHIGSEEKEQLEEEKIQSIREIIDYNQEGRIEFSLDSVEKLREYWKRKYSEFPLLRDFRSAFKRMGAWQDNIEASFQNIEVPKEYTYLAIPESHWRIQSRSPKGAAGPYQFIRQTARGYRLKISNQLDERLDPLLASSACALY